MTHPQQNQILNKSQIEQKIIRMAYEIYEQNFEEQELVLAGIDQTGYTLAEMLTRELQKISPITVTLIRAIIDKSAPADTPVQLKPETVDLKDKAIVLVDDVLNTGRILTYALAAFLQYNPRKIEIATLVNRSHTLFPVAATYTGYSLATTLRNHISVVLQEDEVAAYLI
ncbi:phosphoribosyltransferase [Pontibacter qinzhouensis]|uniref:Phosphoribosyltransferase n=1 Tax=Pontibacter qinzhouensis TaxID=2603253 RepID=A0A5C8IU22_9BACT|nr:phosphoribosyltransferase family protein [Pontibacter qinzhouensis]TXK24750.1 phosphoribosyltransferase [Pontibacter qinzhouensis]